MHVQHITVPLSAGRVHKHTETFARRVVRTMTSEKTPHRGGAADGALKSASASSPGRKAPIH